MNSRPSSGISRNVASKNSASPALTSGAGRRRSQLGTSVAAPSQCPTAIAAKHAAMSTRLVNAKVPPAIGHAKRSTISTASSAK